MKGKEGSRREKKIESELRNKGIQVEEEKIRERKSGKRVKEDGIEFKIGEEIVLEEGRCVKD